MMLAVVAFTELLAFGVPNMAQATFIENYAKVVPDIAELAK